MKLNAEECAAIGLPLQALEVRSLTLVPLGEMDEDGYELCDLYLDIAVWPLAALMHIELVLTL